MAFTKPQSDPPGIDNHGCAAYGCPLPGSMSHGAGPGIRYYCRFHNGLSTEKLDKVSFRINTHLARVQDLLATQYGHQTHTQPRDKTVSGAEGYNNAERDLRALLLNDIDQSPEPPPPLAPTLKPQTWTNAKDYADRYHEGAPT